MGNVGPSHNSGVPSACLSAGATARVVGSDGATSVRAEGITVMLPTQGKGRAYSYQIRRAMAPAAHPMPTARAIAAKP